MNHERSVGSNAAERYLLGEMSELERHRFEEHYFSCEDCAESVRLGSTLAENVRAAFAENAAPAKAQLRRHSGWEWLRLPVLAPSLAALALACVVGYQAVIEMPALRRGFGASQAIEPVALHSASRGTEQTVQLAAGHGFFSVAVFVTADSRLGEISYVLDSPSGEAASGTAPIPSGGRPLMLLFPTRSVRSGQRYTLHLRQSGRDLEDIPFLVSGR